jgi:aryl-alcohol dehydrogenase-like predicted oxidoreductase
MTYRQQNTHLRSHPTVRLCFFFTSIIIGATTLEQLKENIDSIEIELSREILRDIDAVHGCYPNPTP